MAIIAVADAEVLVDDRDFGWLSEHKWYLSRGKRSDNRYAMTGHPTRYMHRMILERYEHIPDGMVVHHRNDDCYDNRLENLEAVSQSANIQAGRKPRGRSNYLGVGWHKARGKWRAYSSHGDKYVHLGQFSTEEEAALAYDRHVLATHGTTARTNILAA